MEIVSLRAKKKTYRDLKERPLLPDRPYSRQSSLLVDLSSKIKMNFRAEPDWLLIDTICGLNTELNILGREICNGFQNKHDKFRNSRNNKRQRWKRTLEKRYGKENVEVLSQKPANRHLLGAFDFKD